MKKCLSIIFAVVLTLAIAATAFAAKITVTDDRTYEVYQIFTGDLDGTTLSNIKWGEHGTGTEGQAVDKVVLDALTAVSSKSDAEKIKVIETYLKSGAATSWKVSSESSLDGLATGYYLLKDVTEALPEGAEYSIYIVELVGDVNVTAKAGQPVPDKKVKDINDSTGAGDWGTSADYDIGDDVPFRISGTVSDKYDAYDEYYYCFHDTLSAGLTFNNDSVTVEVDGKAVDASKYTVVTEGLSDGCSFEVRFNNLKDIADVKANSKITVEYTAKLNDSAVIGKDGNTNKVNIEFSNNPNGDDHATSADKNVIVFTYKLVVNKVDESSEPLAGAGFTLYKKNTEGNWDKIKEFAGGTDTTFTWSGLDDGDYKLSETTTPAGYNTMADIEFTINAEHNDTGITKLETITLTSTADLANGTLTSDIVNNKGTILPETGAGGTIAFIAIGSVLTIAAVVFLVARKKMSVYMD